MGFADLLEEVSPWLIFSVIQYDYHVSQVDHDAAVPSTPPHQVGGFGRYQWLHVTLISLPGLMLASQNLLNNFVSGTPVHHCSLPANFSLYNLSHHQLLNVFIPLDSSGNRLDRCRRYAEPQWQLLAANNSANISQLQTEECVDGWTFDHSEFQATTVSEWNLVCSLHPLKQMIQTIYMGGVLAGAIIYGGLSDRFGRRSVLIWSYLQLGIFGCSSALSPSYSAYCIFRFLSGMAVSGIILNGVSLKVEWIPTKARTLVGTLTSFFVTFGQMILAGLAYWLRDWRKLQVFVCAPHFLWYSESARWLVLNRRSEDALKNLHRVARINGKPEMIDKLTLESHMSKEIDFHYHQHSYILHNFLSTSITKQTFLCLCWVFQVSIYLIQIIFGAVDLPAKLLALGMLSYLGRRISQATCLFLSAIIIFANILVPTDMQAVRTTLACLGKGFTSASFTTVYLYTGELYPTAIRQTGMGFVSTMARVGSMAAPAVLILDEVFPALPSIVYGGAAVLAGCFACFLPETLNIPLPDTIEDVEGKWSGRSPVSQDKEGISFHEEVVGVLERGVALKELKETEATGLNAL
uniref:Solute carrier family 22 member 6-like n=1 Tax=Echeneis naucrates TaxID=173247 RepID=A0A665T9L5_ECHNA